MSELIDYISRWWSRATERTESGSWLDWTNCVIMGCWEIITGFRARDMIITRSVSPSGADPVDQRRLSCLFLDTRTRWDFAQPKFHVGHERASMIQSMAINYLAKDLGLKKCWIVDGRTCIILCKLSGASIRWCMAGSPGHENACPLDD